MKQILLLILVIGISGAMCSDVPLQDSNAKVSRCNPDPIEKLRGVSFVAPRNKWTTDPSKSIKAANAEWITVIPYAYSPHKEPVVHYNTSGWQWWGERPEGVRETIRMAKSAGLKVMMKPQIWMRGVWIGQMDFDTNEDWENWEAGYVDYLMPMVEIAAETGVELICIGTEIEISAQKREKFWRGLIKKIRAVYDGKLTYAANWDGFEKVPFWDALDYVGIDAYFPLIADETPSIKKLQTAWKPHFQQIENFYCKTQVPILFTEYGYLSTNGCAYNTWELEKNMRNLPTNERAQANAYEALFEVFWDKNWWAGGFAWKWFPNLSGSQDRRNKDYTPQGKLAEQCLKKWYGKEQ